MILNKVKILSLLLLTSSLFAQMVDDSLNSDFNILKLNSLKTDWKIVNSQLLFHPMNTFNSSGSNNSSLYSMYTYSQINSGFNIELGPDVMLSQFQLANNWEAKNKYGVFAKYLGIAQFMGAVGLAAIHISKFHTPPKGKINSPANENMNLKEPKIKKP
jgi:hypothetical protein